jgi:hypothetical protein
VFQNSTDERDRLEALKSFDILDTFADKDYDDITRMTSIICDSPVALISFIDEDRQWIKSHHGVALTEIMREHSFCTYAI